MVKILKKLLVILLVLLLALVVGVFVWWKMAQRTRYHPQLLESSAPGRVTLDRQFYACGNECPNYLVVAAEGELAAYRDQMTHLADPTEASGSFYSSSFEHNATFEQLWNNKFVCSGHFELYETSALWECCLDGARNLVFRAETCQLLPKDFS